MFLFQLVSLLTLCLTSSQPIRSNAAGCTTSHRWRRNAETGCSSWGPWAAHRAIQKPASLQSVTHRSADTPCVYCTCWWTKLWRQIIPLWAIRLGGGVAALTHTQASGKKMSKTLSWRPTALLCGASLLLNFSWAKSYFNGFQTIHAS